MVNVTESDVSVASRILHDKSKKAKVLRWGALGIVIASFFFFSWETTLDGNSEFPENLLMGALIAGFVALWLGFLASSVLNIWAAWRLGAPGKASVVIAIAILLVVCGCFSPGFHGVWGFTTFRLSWMWFALFGPFAIPVLIDLCMLVAGFFMKSPSDGDERLAQAIRGEDEIPAQDTPTQSVPDDTQGEPLQSAGDTMQHSKSVQRGARRE